MEIEEYRKAYEDIFSKVGDKDVALALLSHVAKDRRTEQINKNGRSSNGNGYSNGNASEKATQSQLNYLRMLGIEAKPNLSKADASTLIDEAKAK